MQLFPDEPDFIPGTKGFADVDAASQPHDLLQRAETGKQLSDLLERITQPLVVALDGEWGSGKSHFLKLWTGAHGENGGKARVVYFDAFEHDFLDDPLIGLVGAIAATHEPTGKIESGLATLRKWGAKLAKPAARITIAAATGGASELAAAIADPIISATGDELTSLAEDFCKKEDGRRAAMVEFRRALSALTSGPDGEQKLIIVVDELDRCRPDFALNLLEVIKHFFSVPNVHFVLGVNLDALAHSVRARYGQGCDAGLYLQKFVHVTMELPRQTRRHTGSPDVALTYYDAVSARMGVGVETHSVLRAHLGLVVKAKRVSLRDIQRILGHTLLVPNCERMAPGYRMLAITAILLRVLAPETYQKLRRKQVSNREILEFYGILNEQTDDSMRTFPSALNRLWKMVAGSGSDNDLSGVLGDFFGGNRRDYVEQFFQNHLDTFTLTP